jgi:hypothetical protein
MDATTIGTLVTFATAIVSALKEVNTLVGSPKPVWSRKSGQTEVKKLEEDIRKLYHRLGTLTSQLERSEYLRMIAETWLYALHAFERPITFEDNVKAETIHEKLKEFLYRTESDYFSRGFFGTEFPEFPDLESSLAEFRVNLNTAKSAVFHITDARAFKSQWPATRTLINNLENSGRQVSTVAQSVHDALIMELKDAAKVPV